jgi:CRP-like cAMP-binding protein
MAKPSLIPVDVLQEVRRQEADLAVERAEQESEPKTAPTPIDDDLMMMGSADADLEVAMFALSQVPMFRGLPTASLEALATGTQQVDIPGSEVLFVEGDEAKSFYVVIDGELELAAQRDGRETLLRLARKGEALGLFGLFGGHVRAASARASGDCTVLEVASEKLQQLIEHDDALHTRLLGFYRARVVEAFLSSKLFTELVDSAGRARLASRFRHVEYKAGTTVMEPGEVSNLIGVVTHGRLMLEDRAQPGKSPRHFELTQGQFLIMTSALSGQPSKLRVLTPEYTTVSMLDQRDLNELLRDYPALRSLPNRLPAYARALDRDVFCGHSGSTGH